jgi:glycosyltransferase involved in cell wall biosynthesis
MEIGAAWGRDAGPRPFLTVVTRCYRRPKLLDRNLESLAMQSCQDYQHLFIIDHVGEGVGAANKALSLANPAGEYVLVLDDDDLFTDPDAIAMLKEYAVTEPDLIVFKADHGELGILPSARVWHRRPRPGEIGSCDFVTRCDWWQRHIAAFGAPEQGDYAFLMSMWADAPAVTWLDHQLTAVQRISRGKPE